MVDLIDDAFGNIIKEGGLRSEDGICKASSCGEKYNKIKSYTDVTRDDSAALEFAVAEGCVSVAIGADQFAFQFYSGDLLTGSCGISLHHDVLVVGHRTDGDQEYSKSKIHWEANMLLFFSQLSLLLIVNAASMVQ